jgi:hypothetical protein
MLRQVTVLAARSASRLALKTPASACGALRCYYKYTASHEWVKVRASRALSPCRRLLVCC